MATAVFGAKAMIGLKGNEKYKGRKSAGFTSGFDTKQKLHWQFYKTKPSVNPPYMAENV